MDRRKAIRYLAYSLELIVLFILQETPGLMFSLWGERPSFLFLCMIAIAQFESEIPAMAFGVFGGLLVDYGMGGVMGMHALIMGVLCYIISSFSRNLLRNNLTVCSSCFLHNTAITVASVFPRCSPLLFQYKHKTGMTEISSKYG